MKVSYASALLRYYSMKYSKVKYSCLRSGMEG